MEHAEDGSPEHEAPFRAEILEITEPLLKVLADSLGIELRSWSAYGNWNFAGLYWTRVGGLVLFLPAGSNRTGIVPAVPLETAPRRPSNTAHDAKSIQADILETLDIAKFREGGTLTNSDGTRQVDIPEFKSTSELKMKLALLGRDDGRLSALPRTRTRRPQNPRGQPTPSSS